MDKEAAIAVFRRIREMQARGATIMFGHDPDWTHHTSEDTVDKTDARGMARILLRGPGNWHVKFIHMASANDPQFNYESHWATLTFAIAKKAKPDKR